uniref:Structure-specific endonuclease subunit SLX4 n=1 Tax=Cryptococcus gattii TaxID=552467 RepID=F6KJQ9_CRYGA|nr:BSP1 [Cryptococcus gattii]
MPPRLSTRVSTSSTSSDEPVYLDCPPSFASAPFRRRNASIPSAAKSSNRKLRTKAFVVSDEDDEPEFIGRVLGGLAEKYRFKEVSDSAAAENLSRSTKEMSHHSSKNNAKRNSDIPERSDAISSPSAKTWGRSDNLPKQPESHALLPDLGPGARAYTRVAWLHACPICKLRWKGKESGIARWRHMTICRPPFYRPPNTPPNLQQLIHNALSRRTEPSSLLEWHTRSLTNDVDCFPTEKSPSASKKPNTRNASKGRRPRNVATITGLTSVTNVHPSDDRGEGWEEEVSSRIRDWIGPSSPSTLSENENAFIQLSPSNESIWSASQIRAQDDDYFPPTQPFDASSLAKAYPRPGSSSFSLRSSNSFRVSNMSPHRSRPLAQREILIPASDSEDEDIGDNEPVKDSFSEKGCRISPNQMTDIAFDDEDAYQPPFRSWRDLCTAGNPSQRTLRPTEAQDEFLIPQKKDHQNKSVVFTPYSKSYALNSGKVESPIKDGECEGFDFDINQDGAMLTRGGNSSAHHDHDILQKNEAGTPSVSSSSTVDSILEYSNVTDSELSKVGWGEENGFGSIEEEVQEGICGREERRRDLRMPDYDSWDVKALQLLTADYGYRSVKDRSSLVWIATECWKALNPLEAEASEGNMSLGEPICLGNGYLHVSEGDGNYDQKQCKGGSSEGEGSNKGKSDDNVDLHDQFHNIIVNDHDLYLRILHYEPVAFDELVIKAIASGMTRRGWKKELKNYLDLQNVTYFTGDSTSRRGWR